MDDGGTITPHVRLAWAHEFTGSAWQVSAALSALPGSNFAVSGPAIARDKAYINLGLDIHISDTLETTLNYDGMYNADQSQQSLMGILRLKL